ncbi:MAG TPA: PEPxxWA-CTERM sorting domain-containing protein [Sphingobium sp.]|nr:PEPxxWA-CTERM sorting domain-containing protein [Sphingobium sp.]
MRKSIKTVGIAAVVLMATAPAHAATFFDSFDSENGGLSALNYTGFANFTTSGQVDLVRSGDYGITCSGSCVDLDGTPGAGTLISNMFSYNAGDTVTLSFDLGGSQRVANGTDNVTIMLMSSTDGTVSDSFDLASSAAFQTYSYAFTATADGTVTFSLGTTSQDYIGPLVDNVSLDIAAIPEPATWAMMIAGFTIVGSTMRRRKVITSFV